MAITEKAQVEVQVNSQQAQDNLQQLKAKASELHKAMSKALEVGDTKLSKKLDREIKSIDNEIKTVTKDTSALKDTMENLDKASPKELRKTLKEINRELNSGHVTRGSKQWREYQQQAKMVRTELQKIRDETKETQSWLGRFNDKLSKWGGLLTTVAAAITGVAMTLNTLRKNRNNKEDAQHELKALTGLGDDSIEWLTKQAEILSTTMEQSGLRIRQSSEEILKAYMLVGSKKPELLGNKEALNAVTIEAMRLAAAAKIDLTEAVEATTVSLNMFGEKADQAAKYVNVLAAGSQAGSASVAAQTATIKNAAVAAAGCGVTIEQLNGVIQTLAKKGIEAEPAGTALRKFFLVLQTGADETNPAVVGLDKALENMAAQEMTAADIKKRFGEEAFSAASIIINSIEDYKHFTAAVTDTNVAVEQAAINSDTASAKLEQHRNEIKEAGIELMERLNPSLAMLTGWTSKIISALPVIIDWFIEFKAAILAAAAGVVTYTVAVNAAAIKTKLLTFWTKGLEVATGLLNRTMKLSPWGLALSGAVALGTYLFAKMIPNTEKAAEAQRKYNDELRNMQEALERFQNVESRYDNIDILNDRQRQKLKSDAQSELAVTEDKLSKETILFRKFYDEQKKAIAKRRDINETQRGALYKSLDSQVRQKADELDYLLKRKQKLTEIINAIPDQKTKVTSTNTATPGSKENAAELAEEKRYQNELLTLKQTYLESSTMTRENYNRLVEDAEVRHLETMLKVAGIEPEKRQQILSKLLELQIKFKEDVAKLDEKDKEEASNEVADRLHKEYELQLDAVTEQYSMGLSSDEEYYNALERIRQNYYDKVLADTSLNESRKNDIISDIEEDRLEKEGERRKKQYKAQKDAFNKTSELAQNYGAQIGSILADSDNKLKDFVKLTINIMLDMLKKQMILKTTAVYMEAMAAPGFILKGAMMAKAFAKIALITAAFETAKGLVNGFEDGGYTGDGAHDDPKGVVHAGEFVANRHAVNNPSVKPVLDLIDNAQRSNTIGSLSAADISAALGGGGNSYSTINNYNSSDDGMNAVITELTVVLGQLEKVLGKPIITYTKATGKMSVNEAQDLVDKMKRNASRL